MSVKRPSSSGPIVTALLAALSASCGATDPPLSSGPAPRYEREMFRGVLTYLTEEKLPVKGDWPEDFGDANYYGPAFFFRYSASSHRPEQHALAQESAAHNVAVLNKAMKNFTFFLEDLDHVMMAGLGVIEAHAYDERQPATAKLNTMLDALQALVKSFDYYPELDAKAMSSYALQTYGPTTINGTLALLHLEYAYTVGGAQKARRQRDGLAVLKKGRELGFDATLGYYRFSSKRPGLYLYPNVVQLLAHVRAYQLTRNRTYLHHAEALYDAIQGLKVKGEHRYRSPYSAKHMGAKTEDYTTLSSQNYTMIALALLYRATAKERYRREVLGMLGFIRSRLYHGGRILHHWIDGELAQPTDKEYYCTGCNLQTLYLIWRLEDLFAPP